MENFKFKLYKPKDYCDDSLTFKAIKYSLIDAWNSIYERYKTGQAFRPNPDVIKPETTFEDILYRACKKNNLAKDCFMYNFRQYLNPIFKGVNFGNPYVKDYFPIAKDVSLLNLYNYLKTKEINPVFAELLEKVK